MAGWRCWNVLIKVAAFSSAFKRTSGISYLLLSKLITNKFNALIRSSAVNGSGKLSRAELKQRSALSSSPGRMLEQSSVAFAATALHRAIIGFGETTPCSDFTSVGSQVKVG